jgi:hypothetical protein
MKRWAVVVVVLYVLTLIALTWPLWYIAFYPRGDLREVADVVSMPAYWMWLVLMAFGQAAMLLVPVSRTSSRPVHRRPVIWPALASGLMMALLACGFVAAVYEFLRKDKALDVFDDYLPLCLAGIAGCWLVWTLVFYRVNRGADAMDVVTRQCRLLLKGSILELLVAVPTQIVARYRDYCCAGALTFLGIAFGLSVMIFSFGPGVFLLFVHRWRQLHPHLAGPAGKA